MKRKKQWILPVVTLAVLLGVWELAVDLLQVSSYVLPAPSAIAAAIVTDVSNLWMHSMVTLGEAVAGLLIAAVLAVLLAVAMDLSRVLYRCAFPILVATQTIPVLVLGPLFTIWFGFGMAPKVLMVVFMCFFPIAIGLTDALRAVDEGHMNLLRSFGASRVRQYLWVKLPAAGTALLSGMKVAATYCMGGAIVGEWLSASAGLGYYMMRLKNGFQMEQVFACVLAVMLWSLLLHLAVCLLERLLFPYKYEKEWAE